MSKYKTLSTEELDLISKRLGISLSSDENQIDSINYDRQISSDGKLHKARYFAVEDSLIESFNFILPTNQYAHVQSLRFGTVIKESSSFFEQLSKWLITSSLCKKQHRRYNLCDFLAVAHHLALQDIKVESPLLLDGFPDNKEILQPFHKLSRFNEVTEISAVTPDWWNAYNEAKHSSTIENSSNLGNALASTSAVFCLLDSIYGPGAVSGILSKPLDSGGASMVFSRTSKLFISIFRSL